MQDANKSTDSPHNDTASSTSPQWADYHAVDTRSAVYLADMVGVFNGPWTADDAFWPTVTTYSAAFLIGIAGNGFVVFVLLADKKARNVTSLFLVSLAVSDILFLTTSVPNVLVGRYTGYWEGGRALCKLASFAELLSATASALNLTAVSVERFVVIVHPLKSRSWCTMGRAKKIIATAWVCAIVLTLPSLYIMGINATMFYNDERHVLRVVCADALVGDTGRLLFAWYQLVIVFVVPSVVMVYCYVFVIRVLWTSSKELAKLTQSRSRSSDDDVRQQLTFNGWTMHHFRSSSKMSTCAPRDHCAEIRRARRQVIKMLLTIIVVFLLSWGPKLILHIMKRHDQIDYILHTEFAYTIMLIVVSLPYVQSAANPLIYSVMSNNFRRSMRVACRMCCRWGERCRVPRRRRSACNGDSDQRSANTYLHYSPPIVAQRKQTENAFF